MINRLLILIIVIIIVCSGKLFGQVSYKIVERLDSLFDNYYFFKLERKGIIYSSVLPKNKSKINLEVGGKYKLILSKMDRFNDSRGGMNIRGGNHDVYLDGHKLFNSDEVYLIEEVGKPKSSKVTTVEVEDINQFCEFVQIVGSFEMKIIDFISSEPCGTRASASICIGFTSELDTIRVLSLCNMDTTFRIGEVVTITPAKKPNFFVSIAQYVVLDKNNILLPDFQVMKLKTTYGKIEHQSNLPRVRASNNDKIVFRVVQDGTNDGRNAREIESGEIDSNAKYYFINMMDTIEYTNEFDFNKIKPSTSFVVVYKNDTLLVPNLEKYICPNLNLMIQISYDVLNTNSSNILITSNGRSCGDLYITDDTTELNIGYHLIQFDNFNKLFLTK